MKAVDRLKSVIRSKEETQVYMTDLKRWLNEVRDVPVEEMAEFFTQRISIYEKTHLDHWAQEYTHIADYFDGEVRRLLDLGCGTGLELEAVYRRYPDVRVTGIDLSDTMLEELRKKYHKQAPVLIQADYVQYPFDQEEYDAVMSFESLHHLEYDQKREIYKKIYRTVRPGGCYLECDYVACCDEEELLCLEEYLYRRKRGGIPEDHFVHIDIPLTLGHQVELLQLAGFSGVCILYQNCGTVILKAVKECMDK